MKCVARSVTRQHLQLNVNSQDSARACGLCANATGRAERRAALNYAIWNTGDPVQSRIWPNKSSCCSVLAHTRSVDAAHTRSVDTAHTRSVGAAHSYSSSTAKSGSTVGYSTDSTRWRRRSGSSRPCRRNSTALSGLGDPVSGHLSITGSSERPLRSPLVQMKAESEHFKLAYHKIWICISRYGLDTNKAP